MSGRSRSARGSRKRKKPVPPHVVTWREQVEVWRAEKAARRDAMRLMFGDHDRKSAASLGEIAMLFGEKL